MLANLFPHVRIHHILPRDRNSEVFDMALARNLFPFHPLSNFASQSSAGTKFAPWDPRTPPNVYTRPRLFVPYFEECKVSILIDMVLSTLGSGINEPGKLIEFWSNIHLFISTINIVKSFF